MRLLDLSLTPALFRRRGSISAALPQRERKHPWFFRGGTRLYVHYLKHREATFQLTLSTVSEREKLGALTPGFSPLRALLSVGNPKFLSAFVCYAANYSILRRNRFVAVSENILPGALSTNGHFLQLEQAGVYYNSFWFRLIPGRKAATWFLNIHPPSTCPSATGFIAAAGKYADYVVVLDVADMPVPRITHDEQKSVSRHTDGYERESVC